MPKDNKIKSSVSQRLRPSKRLCYDKLPNESQNFDGAFTERVRCDHMTVQDYYLQLYRWTGRERTCCSTNTARQTVCLHMRVSTLCGEISSLDRMLLFSWWRFPTKRWRPECPRVISETASRRHHHPNESVFFLGLSLRKTSAPLKKATTQTAGPTPSTGQDAADEPMRRKSGDAPCWLWGSDSGCWCLCVMRTLFFWFWTHQQM